VIGLTYKSLLLFVHYVYFIFKMLKASIALWKLKTDEIVKIHFNDIIYLSKIVFYLKNEREIWC